eukprot:scaffold37281_cov44-Attheya_sp.AAC.3
MEFPLSMSVTRIGGGLVFIIVTMVLMCGTMSGVDSFVVTNAIIPWTSRIHSTFCNTGMRLLLPPPQQRDSSASGSFLILSAKPKRKQTFAEKKRQRAKRGVPTNTPASMDTVVEEEAVVVDNVKITNDDNHHVETTKEEEQPIEMKKAAKLISAQRKSVATLTFVKERVEALNYEEISNELKSKGWFVVDDFMGSSTTSTSTTTTTTVMEDDLVEEMAAECEQLLEEEMLELDVAHVASGEYCARLEGGERQYKYCPRCIEFLVSATRHMAPNFTTHLKHDWNDLNLNEKASMGSVRVYSRRAQQAAESLLKQRSENDDDDASSLRAFGYANGGDSEDARKITLLYFVTPHGWDTEDCGGGITIRQGEKDSEDHLIRAKRDRLVIFRSDSCLVRMDAWKGNDDGKEMASSIVTHLVQT